MTTLPERQHIMTWLQEATQAGARLEKACEILGLSVRTFQRWQAHEADAPDQRTLRQHAPSHALSSVERAAILAVVNSPQYGHLPPTQIVPRLADEGVYLGSESTFYRVMHAEQLVSHRRSERPAQTRHKPEALSATGPNQVYSWDITYLPTTILGQYFYLYLFLDIFTRKIVGWQIYERECNQLASALITDICYREGVEPGQVTLHSDNGAPMKGATMLATLQTLGVAPSFSRPSVSNDNPYSESLFRTLKYRPEHPVEPFETVEAARLWVDALVTWYNTEHRHSSINFVTPEQRHTGEDTALLAARTAVYEKARAENPRRWKRKIRDWSKPTRVFLNPNKGKSTGKPSCKEARTGKKEVIH